MEMKREDVEAQYKELKKNCQQNITLSGQLIRQIADLKVTIHQQEGGIGTYESILTLFDEKVQRKVRAIPLTNKEFEKREKPASDVEKGVEPREAKKGIDPSELGLQYTEQERLEQGTGATFNK